MTGSTFRAGPDALRYAKACLDQGMSYAASARAAGVNELDLRDAFPVRRPADRTAPKLDDRTAFERCAAILPEASPSDLRRTVALALSMLADTEGTSGVVSLTNTIIAALPHPQDIPTHARVSGYEIARHVASHFDIDWDTFTSAHRARCVARPRQIAMAAMRRFAPHLSLPKIGRILGGRDHTTIIHGVETVARLYRVDPEFAGIYDRAIDDLRARFSDRLLVAA